ncbi:MAG: glycosyltransferase [Planctomycetes bacterium]|nr:glycosyltransferase [Planctomycetota bacterium]
MRVLIDITHPAHLHFFRHAIAELRAAGHHVHLTARDKDVLLALGREHGLTLEVMGGTPRGAVKMAALLARRKAWLAGVVGRERPDVIAALGGTFIGLLSKLVGVPSVVFYDTESARLSNAITYPFATRVVTPACYLDDVPRQVRYRGYHELAYLHPDRFTPDPRVRDELGLAADEPYALVRFVGWSASHDLGRARTGAGGRIELVRRLSTRVRTFVSTEGPLPAELENLRFPLPPSRMHDALAFARVLVGESSTMASEAAVLGVPSVFVYPRVRLGYTEEQERRWGLIRWFTPEQLAEAGACAERLAAGEDGPRFRETGRALVQASEDVTPVIVRELAEVARRTEPSRLRVAVTAGLSDDKLRSKLTGLAGSDRVERVVLVRRRPLSAPPPRTEQRTPVGLWAATRPTYELWRLWTLGRLAWTGEVDALVGIQLVLHGVAASVSGHAARVPVVLCPIGTDLHHHAPRGALGFPLRWALRSANAVGILGTRSRRRVGGYSSAPLVDIRNHLDANRWSPTSPEERHAVFVGALLALKQVDEIVRAFARVAHDRRDLHLDVVGDGPERRRLERLVTRLGANEQVSFIGPRADPSPWVRRARCLVLASRWEGLPAVAVEAMLAGVPVISTRVGDIEDLVEHGVNGLLVSAEVATELDAALRGALTDDALHAHLRTGALATRERWLAQWGPEGQRAAWSRLLEAAFSQEARGGGPDEAQQTTARPVCLVAMAVTA